MSTAPPTTYRNPCHKPGKPEYGPEHYITRCEPEEYRGYLIYHRIASVWDIVKDGVCVTQMAGPRGARGAIDKLIEEATQGRERIRDLQTKAASKQAAADSCQGHVWGRVHVSKIDHCESSSAACIRCGERRALVDIGPAEQWEHSAPTPNHQ